MGGQIRQLVIITIFSLFSRYNSLEEGPFPPYNYFEDVSAGYDPQAYPSYFTTIQYANFEDLISQMNQLQRIGIITSPSTKTVNVDDFGATGDDAIHGTQAFEKAWEEACWSKGEVVLEVPQGKCYQLKSIRISGPCKSNLTLQIYGCMEASDDMSDYMEDTIHWLSLTSNVQAAGLMVTAPEKSPNTDGIHFLSYSKHTDHRFYHSNWYDYDVLTNLNLFNQNSLSFYIDFDHHVLLLNEGDDCISIVSGSQNVQGMNITYGPGHGISIGSLGSKNSKAYVSGVTVDGAKLVGTTNGGGSGSESNIIFQNIEMFNVSNPIIIDQNYCDQDKPCKEQSSAVQMRSVVYKNIIGTSASEVAIKFDCSKTHPCQGILLQNVCLQKQGDATAKAICNNVELSEIGTVFPQCL
ncbi:Detected protein of unknown function [Hibiscus syriacus]|uniref:Polygalacturonase n=1 Tax=Hibiscus syriacus TaxID=106335 RepID=A0A6A3BQE5_HIBSY|nr:Detected protein of unknown function [Hibiscus syriacus]